MRRNENTNKKMKTIIKEKLKRQEGERATVKRKRTKTKMKKQIQRKNFLKTAQHGTNARLVCMVHWGLQLVPLLGLSYECCKITQSSIKSILYIHF